MYARNQAALAELTQLVLADTSLPTLMRQAITSVTDTLAVEYSTIWELLPGGTCLVPRWSSGCLAQISDETAIALSVDSSLGAALLSKSPVQVTDWPSERRFTQPPLLRDHEIISSIYVPIPGRVGPFGSLTVDVPASRLFSDEEIHFLVAVSNILALAIERVQPSQACEQQLPANAQYGAVREERQRIARELHDSVTQALYGITLHAQAARQVLALGNLATASESLQTLQQTAQEALDEMRLLIFELRPPILEQVGLAAALQARLSAVEGRANLQTHFVGNDLHHLPALTEQILYRIAQEALTNALKHAHAQHIIVRLQQAQASVILEIADDGIGFELALAEKTGGVGLRGIKERVDQLNGDFTLRSSAGAGTLMRVEIAV